MTELQESTEIIDFQAKEYLEFIIDAIKKGKNKKLIEYLSVEYLCTISLTSGEIVKIIFRNEEYFFDFPHVFRAFGVDKKLIISDEKYTKLLKTVKIFIERYNSEIWGVTIEMSNRSSELLEPNDSETIVIDKLNSEFVQLETRLKLLFNMKINDISYKDVYIAQNIAFVLGILSPEELIKTKIWLEAFLGILIGIKDFNVDNLNEDSLNDLIVECIISEWIWFTRHLPTENFRKYIKTWIVSRPDFIRGKVRTLLWDKMAELKELIEKHEAEAES